MLKIEKNKLLYSKFGESLTIEAWGENSLRVRASKHPGRAFSDGALTEKPRVTKASCSMDADGVASIACGKLRATVTPEGKIAFFSGDKKLLEEYYRIKTVPTTHINSLHMAAREYSAVDGGESSLTLRFESIRDEHLYGMGQYQQPDLDLKGCTLELAQRNGQITAPFLLSSAGYGFLWNTPAVGKVSFGKNVTEWHFPLADHIDYWVTAGDEPRDIIRQFTEVVGRVPMMPDEYLGLWQCKLRYATQEEVIDVASEYKKRNIPLDVIVIDYIHWSAFGDWKFDETCFPEPTAMNSEIEKMGTKVMVSVWPSVERKSRNYRALHEGGLIASTDRGLPIHTDFYNLAYVDMTNPEARDFVWDRIKEGYVSHGIKNFWLDCAEPEFRGYRLDNYRYYDGHVMTVGNEYPKHYTRMFWDGLRAEGVKTPLSLVRSAWIGSQKYGALVWSGDIESTFDAFRNQIQAGINMGLCGFAWWTTDTGGFMHGDVRDPNFHELLVRWFQYSTFCPVLRMHGDRQDSAHVPDGSRYFAPNELWSYGDEVYNILRKYLDIRLSMKDYIRGLMKEASETGAPLIRAMFYEFPEDKVCWTLEDQYMFGSRYLVAPVTELHATTRTLYLPAGSWKHIITGEVLEGGRFVTVDAPLDVLPAFEKM
jgi:alpha-D-xyloside xylohydrolase